MDSIFGQKDHLNFSTKLELNFESSFEFFVKSFPSVGINCYVGLQCSYGSSHASSIIAFFCIMFFLLSLTSSCQILSSYGIKTLNALLKLGRIWDPQLLVT